MINIDQQVYKKYIQQIGDLIQQDSKIDNLSIEELEELKMHQSKCYDNIEQCLDIINTIPTQDEIELNQDSPSLFSGNNYEQLNESKSSNDSTNDLEQNLNTRFEEINSKVDLLNSKIDIKEQAIQEQNLIQLQEFKEQLSENNYPVDESKYSEQIQYLTNQVNFLLNKINSSNTETYLLEILNLTKKINQIESNLKSSNSSAINQNISQIEVSKNSDDSSIILDKMKKLIQDEETLNTTKSPKLEQVTQDGFNIDELSKSKNIDISTIQLPNRSTNPKEEDLQKNKNKDAIRDIKKMLDLDDSSKSKINKLNINKEGLEIDKIGSYKFSKNKNPFDYVYDDVSELAFSKKSLMSGGGKLQRLKIERKKLILGHLKQQN